MPQQVDAHRRRVVRAPGPRLQPDREADLLLQSRVPGGGPRHRHGEGRGGADHDAARAVAEPDSRDAEPRHRAGHERPPAEQHGDQRQQPPGQSPSSSPSSSAVAQQRDQPVGGCVGVDTARPDVADRLRPVATGRQGPLGLLGLLPVVPAPYPHGRILAAAARKRGGSVTPCFAVRSSFPAATKV